jgi:hypothetical protein
MSRSSQFESDRRQKQLKLNQIVFVEGDRLQEVASGKFADSRRAEYAINKKQLLEARIRDLKKLIRDLL